METEKEAKEKAIKLKGKLCCPSCGSRRFDLVTEIRDTFQVGEKGEKGTVIPQDLEYLYDKNPLDSYTKVECAKCDRKIEREFFRELVSALSKIETATPT